MSDEATRDEGPLDPGVPEPGPRFHGLRIDRKLGAGGNGVVYAAWSEHRQARVALKVLRAGPWASDAQRARFRREIEVHRHIDDAGVVRVLDEGTAEDGTPWFTMELIDGPTLQALLDAGTPPDRRAAVRWVLALARTLARLHARGVFHRDVKPSNVLLARGDEPRLADFGIVLVSEQDRLTMGSRAVGTPRFMAPELSSGEVLDWRRVDLYALGTVLGDLLGASRDRSTGTIELAAAPPDLAWIVARATATEPRERYRDLGSFADDLERWLEGRWVRFRPEALALAMRRAARRPVSAAVVLGLAGTVAAGAWGTGHWRASAREAAAEADWERARPRLEALWKEAGTEAAETWIDTFAELPAHDGAAAAGAAWLDLARLQRDDDDVDGAIRSAGNAIVATSAPRIRAEAAEELVGLFRRGARWDPLARLVEDERVPLPAELRREGQVDVALARGEVERARALLPPERAALLAPFAEARALPGLTVGAVDADGDGHLEWVEQAEGVRVPTRDGDRWRVDTGTRAVEALPDGRALLMGSFDAWSLRDGHPEPLPPRPGLVAEVNGRVFVVSHDAPRSLLEHTPRGPEVAHPASDALDAYITQLASGDLDGDGAPELAVSFGPSLGFLVRVFRVGAPGTPIVPIAEERPGFVAGVQMLPGPTGPRLVTTRSHENPSQLLFGAKDPYGGPCRLQSWRLDGGHLRLEQELGPADGVPCAEVLKRADLDGDGVSELLLQSYYRTTVLRQRADGRLERAFSLPNTRVNQVLHADDDPADELILDVAGGATRAYWLVGAADGAGPFPEQPPVAADIEPSGDADIDLLQDLGLPAHAARRAEQRGFLARASRLWTRAGTPEQAVAVLLQALANGPDPDVMEAARSLALRTADPALAEEVVSALAAVDPTRAAEAHTALETVLTPSWSVDLSRPLPPEVDVRVPAAVRHDLAAAEIHVDVPSGIGPVLRVPMRTTGDPVWIRTEGDWTRAEWGSAVAVALRPVAIGASPGAVSRWNGVGSWCRGEGAGRVLFRACSDVPRVSAESDARDADADYARTVVRSVDETWPFALRIGGTGEPGVVSVYGTRGGVPVRRFRTAKAPPAGEAWELIVAGDDGWGAPPGQLASLVLRRLEVGGLAVDATVAGQREPAAVAWANHRVPLATAPEEDPVLVGLVRLDRSVLDRVAGEWGTAARARLFSAAWATALANSPGDRQVVDALLSAPPLDGLDAADRVALEVGRAQALLRVGRAAEARDALERIWYAGAGGLAGWRARFEAGALLAEVALALGDEGGAQTWAGRAAEGVPDRDLAARLLRNRSRLADRVGRPGWEVLGG